MAYLFAPTLALIVLCLASLIAVGLGCASTAGPATTAASTKKATTVHTTHKATTTHGTTKKPTTTSPTQATTTTGGSQAVCSAIVCNFANGPCQYTSASNGGGAGWATSSQRVGNPDTGVFPDGTNPPFMATPVNPMQTSTLKSGTFTTSQTYTLKFVYWEDTDKMTLKACLNSQSGSCPFSSDYGATAQDRKWRQASMQIPSGTTQLFFCGEKFQRKSVRSSRHQ